MKRVYVLSMMLLFVLLGWSQSTSSSQQINIKYKNGNSVQINANDIDYIEFTETGNDNPQPVPQPVPQETSTTIEGTWYMKSVTWYNYYTDGTKEEKRSSDNRTYADYAEDEIWKLAKSGNNYIWTEIEKGYSPETHTWEKLGNNEFKCSLDGKNHKIVITSIENNKMVLEWTENYDGDPSTSKGSKPHYSVGVHTLLRK